MEIPERQQHLSSTWPTILGMVGVFFGVLVSILLAINVSAFNRLDADIKRSHERIDAHMAHTATRFDAMGSRLDAMGARIDDIHEEIMALIKSQCRKGE